MWLAPSSVLRVGLWCWCNGTVMSSCNLWRKSRTCIESGRIICGGKRKKQPTVKSNFLIFGQATVTWMYYMLLSHRWRKRTSFGIILISRRWCSITSAPAGLTIINGCGTEILPIKWVLKIPITMAGITHVIKMQMPGSITGCYTLRPTVKSSHNSLSKDNRYPSLPPSPPIHTPDFAKPGLIPAGHGRSQESSRPAWATYWDLKLPSLSQQQINSSSFFLLPCLLLGFSHPDIIFFIWPCGNARHASLLCSHWELLKSLWRGKGDMEWNAKVSMWRCISPAKGDGSHMQSQHLRGRGRRITRVQGLVCIEVSSQSGCRGQR